MILKPTKYITKELIQKEIELINENVAELDLSSKPHDPQRIKIIQNIDGINVSKIYRLDLSGNAIEKIENLFALTNLRFLNFSGNKIKRIENLQPVAKNLVELDLSDNMIERIPSSVSHMGKLRVLKLSNNSLDTLGDIQHFGSCKSLIELDLRWNPFEKLPHWRLFTLYNVRSLVIFNNEAVDEDERRTAIDRFNQVDKECLVEELDKCRKERDKLKVELFAAEARITSHGSEIEKLRNSLQVSHERSNFLEKKISFMRSEPVPSNFDPESALVERKLEESERHSKDLVKRLESLLIEKEQEILRVKEFADKSRFDEEASRPKHIDWVDEIKIDPNQVKNPSPIPDDTIRNLQVALHEKDVEIDFIKRKVKSFVEALQKSLSEWYQIILMDDSLGVGNDFDVEIMLANFAATLKQYCQDQEGKFMQMESQVIDLQGRFEHEIQQYMGQLQMAQEEISTYQEMIESKSSRLQMESSLLKQSLQQVHASTQTLPNNHIDNDEDKLGRSKTEMKRLISILQKRVTELTNENHLALKRFEDLEKRVILDQGLTIDSVAPALGSDPRYSYYMDTMKRMLHKRKDKLLALTDSINKAKEEKQILDKEITILRDRKNDLDRTILESEMAISRLHKQFLEKSRIIAPRASVNFDNELAGHFSALRSSLSHKESIPTKEANQRRSSNGVKYSSEEEESALKRNESVIALYNNRGSNASPNAIDMKSIKEKSLQQFHNEGWQSNDGIFTIPKGMNLSESDEMTGLAVTNPHNKVMSTSTPFRAITEADSFLLSPIEKNNPVVLFTSNSANAQFTEKDANITTPLPSTDELCASEKTDAVSDRVKKLQEKLEKKCEHYELMSKLKAERIRSIKNELQK